MKRVIFVGMHNKPGAEEPLAPYTKTGKLLTRVVERIKKDYPNVKFLRTNLYDVDYYPDEHEKANLAEEWHERIEVVPEDDIIVLLGADVHKNFRSRFGSLNLFYYPHPASMRSHEQMDKFVRDLSLSIDAMIVL